MIDYDPFSPEALDDPLPLYRALRDEAPCYFVERRNSWVLSRFQDVWDASCDTEHYTATQGTQSTQVMSTRRQVMPRMLHFMDPPQHTQLARALQKQLGGKAVAEHAETVSRFVDELVSAAAEKGHFDMIEDVAWPLAARIVALVCGFPPGDAPLIQEFTRRYQEREPGTVGPTAAAHAAVVDALSYLTDRVRERRAAGFDGDSMIDTMGRVEIDGMPLGDDPAIAMHLQNFLLGGSTVFPKGFAAVIYRLFENPDQRAQVAADPELLLPAFIEALRMDNPTQMMGRVVRKEHVRNDQRILPGHGMMFLYASAGRDEREFPDPDRFDIHRAARRTLSFGAGPHTCVGGGLARREGEILLHAVLSRMPEYVVDESGLEIIQTEFVKGWKTLPVSVKG